MRQLFCTIPLLFLSLVINGKTTISGTITNSNNSPLYHATIMIEGSFDGCFSDEFGHYSMTTELKGEHFLIIKSTGYTSQRISIQLTDDFLNRNVQLKELSSELNTVTITAGTFEAGDKTKSVTLSSLDMITVPGAQGNVIGALNYLPGTSTNGESGKLFVRGGSSEESQTYIDGALVPIAYNPSAPNTAVRSKFNPFMFDGTVFSTGGFSAEYGQALSSVLLLETKGLQEDDQLDISILSVGLGIAGTKKWTKSAFTLSADLTHLGPYMQLVPQNIDWIHAPSAMNLASNYRFKTKQGLLKVYSTYSENSLQLNRPNLETGVGTSQFNLTNKNYYGNLNYRGVIGKQWIIKLGSSYTFNQDKFGMDFSDVQNKLNFSHTKSVLSRKISNQIKLNFGSELFIKSHQQIVRSGDYTNLLNFQEIIWGGFIETELKLGKKWAGRIGGRLDQSNLTHAIKLAPRASLAFKSGEHSQLSLAYGQFYQQVKDDYLLYTNQLEFEQADQYMLNYQYSKNKRSIRGEIYFKSYKNLVKFTEAPFYSEAHYTNNGVGYAKGVDLFFRDQKTIRHGDYWISYSYLDTRRDYLNYPLETTPSYASKHNFSFVYKHWVTKCRSYFGVSFNYASPRFYNDPNLTDFNTAKMKPYQSLNVNWTFVYRENIIFYSSVSNVLGYKQEFGYTFASTPNSEGIYAKQLIQPAAPRFFILGCFITLSKDGTKNQLDKIE